MIPASYSEAVRRFDLVRELGREVVKSEHANRCAMVISGAIAVRPNDGDATFATSPDLKSDYAGNAALKKYFLKARQLADRIVAIYGKPDLVCGRRGQDWSKLKVQPPGVVYLDNCWFTRTEKTVNFFCGIGSGLTRGMTQPQCMAASGDHIDLWTGSKLKIYEQAENSFRLVLQAETVWYWSFRR